MEKLRILIPGLPENVPHYIKMLTDLGAEVILAQQSGDLILTDGLLIPGGPDINPKRYGQENTASKLMDPAIEELQFAALRLFDEAGRPILGVCNGMQMLNVYFGGDLIQDIENRDTHRTPEGEYTYHHVRAAAGSWLEKLYGQAFLVNSSHHQAAGKIAPVLKAVLFADDNITEGIEHVSRPVIGVQWHPEQLDAQTAQEHGTVKGEEAYRYFLALCAQKRDH